MNWIHLRPATIQDAGKLLDIYSHYVANTSISFEYTPPSLLEFKSRMEETIHDFPWLVCELNKEILGYAYAHKHRLRDAYQWSPETSIYLNPASHTQGIGSILYEALLGMLKLQGFGQAFAGVALPNVKSVGLHQKLGFSEIGVFPSVGFKLGKWHDTLWFSCAIQDLGNYPEKPKKMEEILFQSSYSNLLEEANKKLQSIKIEDIEFRSNQ